MSFTENDVAAFITQPRQTEMSRTNLATVKCNVSSAKHRYGMFECNLQFFLGRAWHCWITAARNSGVMSVRLKAAGAGVVAEDATGTLTGVGEPRS